MLLRLLRNMPKEDLRNKRVLLRVDFEVPVQNGQIQDDYRIRMVFPTIEYLLSGGAKILLLTKRGHFDVQKTSEMSTRALLPYLEDKLKQKITFISSFEEIEKFSADSSSRLFMFENLRFWPEEEKNDESFAKKFANSADIYVSDNFGTAHRNHATVATLPRLMPSYAGFLLEKEVESLEKITNGTAKPVAIILGGAKLETKAPALKKFLNAGDTVLAGGELANIILSSQGKALGQNCINERDKKYLEGADLKSLNLNLPIDGLAGTDLKSAENYTDIADISSNECIFDIGPRTVENFSDKLKSAKTIFWNGPMGIIEDPRCAIGTLGLANQLKGLSAFKILGGGDSIAILEKNNLLGVFNHISTGGGSMLEFLAGDKLPGVEALKEN